MNDKTYGVFATEASRKFIATLENVIEFPVPEIERIDFEIDKLSKIDWLVFLDILAVDCFLQTLQINNFEMFELDDLRVCANGESISDRLRFSQLHADVIPSKNNIETIFKEICDYENPENLKFLITKENTKLADLLKNANAEVAEISTYQIKQVANFTKLKTLLSGGAIDEFIFNSPDEVYYLNDFAKLNKLEIQFSVTEGNSYQTLREFDVNPNFYKKRG